MGFMDDASPRLRLWLRALIVRRHLDTLRVRLLAPLVDRAWSRRLVALLIGRLHRTHPLDVLPANLALLGVPPGRWDHTLRRYRIIRLIRDAGFLRYEYADPAALARRLAHVPLIDRDGGLATFATRPSILCLTHTGEYYLALGCIARTFTAPMHFMLLAERWRSDTKQTAVGAIDAMGHHVELIDASAPSATLRVTRGLRQGKTLIVFCDLPPSYGRRWYGEPMRVRFFGRPAQIVQGPARLASRCGAAILMAGHRITEAGVGTVEVFASIDPGGEAEMAQAVACKLEAFLRASPENWFFLPKVEAFFHLHAKQVRLK